MKHYPINGKINKWYKNTYTLCGRNLAPFYFYFSTDKTKITCPDCIHILNTEERLTSIEHRLISIESKL